MTKKFKPILWMVAGVTISLLSISYFLLPRTKSSTLKPIRPELAREDIITALGKRRISSKDLLPDGLALTIKGKKYFAESTIDNKLQEKIEEIYRRYSPDHAAFVAIDPITGKVLALVDRSIDKRENLALQASFPAASVFKVVTSAAALAEHKIQPNSVIPVNGSYTTLYKRNLQNQVTRWTRFISIEEAFAKSVNTAFAKIAMNRVGSQVLQKYANAFGFNQNIPFDMLIDRSSAIIPEDDSFGLAESGSGYTRRQTLSPIQGALIAASIINDGKMPRPYLVENINTENGTNVYSANKTKFFQPIDKKTAHSLSVIMEHTITQGTARKEYRDYNHHPVLSKIFIGAKTGTLSGDDPEGRYDWFVGFAQSSSNPKQKIAFASLIINRKYWRVKASHVAREALINYFGKSDI